MDYFMKTVLLSLLLSTLIYADELDSLLVQYNEATDLSNMTKKDAAGDIKVITREMLDSMQANTLNDVLNNINFFTLQRSRIGATQIVRAAAKSSSIAPIKIFINDHELNSATFGNPISQYGGMNLYYVDHIEIYQATNSISFGNESAGMIIRVYSKEPARENGTFGQYTVGTNGESKVDILQTKRLEDERYSYLINADLTHKPSANQHTNTQHELKDEQNRAQLFFQLNKEDDYSVNIGFMGAYGDKFAQLSLTPESSKLQGYNGYVNIVKKFNNSVKLKFSSSFEQTNQQHSDDLNLTLINGLQLKDIDGELQTTTTNAILEKEFTTASNNLFVALQLKHMTFSVNKFQADGKDVNLVTGPTIKNLFSIYGENLYSINDNNTFIVGLKYNLYSSSDTFSSTKDSFIYKLGYLSTTEHFSNKIFYLNRVIEPTAAQVTFSPFQVKTDPNLKATETKVLSAFSEYHLNDQIRLSLGGALADIENAIIVNPQTKQYVNSDTKRTLQRVYTTFQYSLDNYNRVELSYFTLHQEKMLSPSSGGYLSLFNKLGKLTLYNELIYRQEYTNELNKKMDAGYTYNLVLSYAYSHRLLFKLKGENLLDRASEVMLYDKGSDGTLSFIMLPLHKRRGLLSVEYTF